MMIFRHRGGGESNAHCRGVDAGNSSDRDLRRGGEVSSAGGREGGEWGLSRELYRAYTMSTINYAYLPPTYQLTNLPNYLPTYLTNYLPTNTLPHIPTYLPTYPTYLLTHLPTYPPTHLPTYLLY